jgi:hypothetical protein
MTSNDEKFITLVGHPISYVTEDGNYGSDSVILFSPDALTSEQWETLSNLGDNSRFDYVSAIMSGEPLEEWEE